MNPLTIVRRVRVALISTAVGVAPRRSRRSPTRARRFALFVLHILLIQAMLARSAFAQARGAVATPRRVVLHASADAMCRRYASTPYWRILLGAEASALGAVAMAAGSAAPVEPVIPADHLRWALLGPQLRY